MSMPALGELRRLYPAARITVLCKPIVKALYSAHPSVDRVHVYEHKGRHSGLLGKLRLGRELRQEGFDMAVLFQNAIDAAIITFLARIPIRAGYARDMRGPFLTLAVPFKGEVKGMHQVFYYLNIIKALGADIELGGELPVPELRAMDEDTKSAEKILKDLKRPYIALAPGASFGPAKKWGIERFRDVGQRLAKGSGGTVLVFGGPADAEEARELTEGFKGDGKCVNLAGKTTLGEFIALASMTDVFITNDSGTMHVAAALGVPTVAVFGSTEPGLTAPLGPKTAVLKKDMECSPCFERTCRYGHYECLSGVTVDEVYASAIGMLEARG